MLILSSFLPVIAYFSYKIQLLKLFTLFLFLLIWFTAPAQDRETYYDYYWKPCDPALACYYSVVKKTDSGWLRQDFYTGSSTVQMQALFADKECKIKNGEAVYFYANGQLQSRGKYVNDKRNGMYIRYHSNGMMADSALYFKEVQTGSRIQWHRNGYMSDSIYRENDSLKVHIQWFEEGQLAAAGYLLHGERYGKWRFHHRSGAVAGEVVYKDGEVISTIYRNEDSSPQTDLKKANSDANFKKGGIEGWKKYVEKSLYWPAGFRLANTTQVTVGVEFNISAEGKVVDAEITVPFHPVFDKIALQTIRNSPDWQPAMEHNRKVMQRFRQSVTFLQEE